MTDRDEKVREALQKADILDGYRINGKPMGLLGMIAWNIRDHGAYGPMESGRESVAQCLEAVEKAVEALLLAPSQAEPPTDWRALASRLNGLHAQMFGIASMDDPALAMQAIQDGGILHEAVHDCLRALPVSAALSGPAPDECACPEHGNWIAAGDVNRLVRELDVLLNGEDGAAKQASLCDIVSQVASQHFVLVRRADVPWAEEVEAIRARHEAAKQALDDERYYSGNVPAVFPTNEGKRAHADRATLLRLLDAAREDLREVREAAGPWLVWADIDDGRPDHMPVESIVHAGAYRRLAAALKAPPTRAQGESS
jgi:hypothetical protein